MRNKGKIIAILLISIMVVVMVVSCDDPMANYSNDELLEIALIGLGASMYAYEDQIGPLGVDDDEEDLPPPVGTHILTKVDYFDIVGPGQGIEEDQLVLLSGKITVKADGSGTIEAKIKINNFEDLPNGTFTVKLSGGLDVDTGTLTVNGKRVTQPND